MNFNQIALELARERQEQLIAEAAHDAPAPAQPPIHPPIARPPRHRGRRADRRGTRTGAGSVPLRAEPAPPAEEILS